MSNERDPIFQDGQPGLTRVHPHLTIFAKSDGQRIIVEHAESLSGLLGEELLTAIKRWQDANPVRDLTVQEIMSGEAQASWRRETAEQRNKATTIVHWPGRDTYTCDDHAAKLVALGSHMGCVVTTTPFDGDAKCKNCENEALKKGA